MEPTLPVEPTENKAVAPADVKITIPGVRVLFTNQQTMDFPLVDNVKYESAPTYQDVASWFRSEQVDFPFSKTSVKTREVVLITMVDMVVMTQEQAEAAALANEQQKAQEQALQQGMLQQINVAPDATYDEALAAVQSGLGDPESHY
jgi:hypothetical protein